MQQPGTNPWELPPRTWAEADGQLLYAWRHLLADPPEGMRIMPALIRERLTALASETK